MNTNLFIVVHPHGANADGGLRRVIPVQNIVEIGESTAGNGIVYYLHGDNLQSSKHIVSTRETLDQLRELISQPGGVIVCSYDANKILPL